MVEGLGQMLTFSSFHSQVILGFNVLHFGEHELVICLSV